MGPPEPELPLGLGALTGSPRSTFPSAMPAGSLMLLCTDGVTEARDGRGRFYPLKRRLDMWAVLGPDAILSALPQDLAEYTSVRLEDDAAVLVLTTVHEVGGRAPDGHVDPG